MWSCDVHKTPVFTAATGTLWWFSRSCQHPFPAFPDQLLKLESVYEGRMTGQGGLWRSLKEERANRSRPSPHLGKTVQKDGSKPNLK